MMAEAFAEYRGTDNPRPLAEAIGRAMDQHLRAPETTPHDGSTEPASGHEHLTAATRRRSRTPRRRAGVRVPPTGCAIQEPGPASSADRSKKAPGIHPDEPEMHRRQGSGADEHPPAESHPDRHLTEGEDGRLHRDDDPPGTYRDEDGTLHRDDDAAGTYRDDDGTLHHDHDSKGTYRSEDGKLHFKGDPANTFRNELTHRLHSENGQFVGDPFTKRDIDHPRRKATHPVPPRRHR